jgi:hypothetical protein
MLSANAERPLFWLQRFVVVEVVNRGMGVVGAGSSLSGDKPSTGRLGARGKKKAIVDEAQDQRRIVS